MPSSAFIKPYYVFFLVFPAGLSQGFATVALPYLLTQNGFTVAQAASIVALGFSANLWRFVWGPIVDLSLSLRRWYWLGLLAAIGTLLALCFTVLTVKNVALLSAIVFVSQVAATFTLLPVNGFIAHRIDDNDKGKASGWYQAGSLCGVGIGGGVGLWLSTHYGVVTSGIFLSVLSVLFAVVVLKIKDLPHQKGETIGQAVANMAKDVFAMIKLPLVLFVVAMLVMPIGSGASANLWSAIAQDWQTGPDTVALVTGIISGLVSAIGCLIGGFLVDKKGVWVGYLGSGAICAVVTIIMSAMPYHPVVFIVGVLAYTFGIGLINAAFTAVIFYAIGKKNVATKYALLASLGNLPVVYMTAINGWTHDRYSSKTMLLIEAAVGLIFIGVYLIFLKKLQAKNLLIPPAD